MAASSVGGSAGSSFLAGHENSLAGLMQELGYGVTADDACFKALMRHLPEPPSEQVVADVLLLMARTHTGLKEPQPGLQSAVWVALGLGQPSPEAAVLNSWNWPLVVDCLKSVPPGQTGRLNWAKVAECLDSERALLPDAGAFALLASAYRRGAGEQLPVAALTGRMWKHPACQLAMLKLAAAAPPEVFSFESSKRLVAPLEGMNVAALSPNRAWASVDLLQALCMLMEGAALVGPARDALQYPAAACPDLLLIAIAETRTTWNLLQRDVFAALLPPHVSMAAQPQPGGGAAASKAAAAAWARSRELLARVWSAAPPEVLLDLLIELYAQDPAAMTPRIARVCAELGVLPQVLAATPVPFALELAAFAGGAGMLNLEAWLADYCQRDSMTGIPALLRYVTEKTADPAAAAAAAAEGVAPPPGASDARRGVSLSAEAARAFLQVLQGASQGLPAEMVRELQAYQSAVAKQFPALAPLITPLQAPDTFPSDVEEEANSYFQAIYNESRPIGEIIARMQAYKASPNPRDQEVFACMIHNLFDEYRFFSRYPDRELLITSALFGGIIKAGLVSSITLGMALRYVLEALRNRAPSKMFTFGLEALRHFVHMVGPWPQFTAAVLATPQLREADPELYSRVEAAAQQHAAAAAAAGGAVPAAPMSVAAPAAAEQARQPPQQPEQPPAQQANANGGPGGNAGAGGSATPPGPGAQGSSRFLQNLQPANTAGQAGGGGAAEAQSSSAGSAAARSAKEAGPSGRNGGGGAASNAAAGGAEPPGAGAAPGGGGSKGAVRDGGGAHTSGAGVPVTASSAVAGGVGALLSNTSLSGEGEGDGVAMNVAAQVAAGALTAPNGPSLAALVNTESLESAADKYRDFKEPPEAVADKIHFVMNNITKDNVESRAGEIRDRVWPDFLPWFANYLVVKRAAQEANFHTLYMSLLDLFNDRELYRLMVKTTMYYVKVLLYSERILKESNDRALLKNLGTWLGLLTFARNKPVMSRDLELKAVIREAYQRGRLIAVLPFLQKLLEGCRASKVFTPSNPMVAGILSLLAELHAIKGLKMNNAFSIELIFKAFGLSPHDVKPSDVLKTLPRERITNPDWQLEVIPGTEMQSQAVSDSQVVSTPSAGAAAAAAAGKPVAPPSPSPAPPPSAGLQPSSPGPMSGTGPRPTPGGALPGLQPGMPLSGPAGPMDAAAKGVSGAVGPASGPEAQAAQQATAYGSMQGPMPGGVGAAVAGVPPTAAAASAAAVAARGGAAPGMPGAAPGAGGLPADAGLFANLHQHVVINPSLGDIGERLVLKRHVPAAVDRAIGEIITPVVERSVTIACYTTYELVLKDFAGDGDEGRLRKAAHLMVSSLAGSLSLVTAKDPLRISLTNQLRQMLQAQVADAATLDNIVSVLVNDNLDLGCTLIERAATDKAVRDIDKSLQAAYDERAKARAAGKPWVDAAAFHSAGSRFPASLPEGLRPRPGGIQPHHLRVYEDFTRIPRTAPAVPTGPPGPGAAPAPGMVAGAAGVPPPPPGVAPRPPGMYPGVAAGAPHGSFQGLDALMAAAGGPDKPAGLGAPGLEVRPDAAAAALLDRYLLWQQAVDAAVAARESNPTADQSDLQALLAELSEALNSGASSPEDAAAFFSRRILKHLYDSAGPPPGAAPGAAPAPSPAASKLSLSFHAACLELLSAAAPSGRLVGELTLAYLGADDERKFNPGLVEVLLRLRLLHLPELDAYLSKLLQTPASRTQAVSDLIFFLLRSMAVRDGLLSFGDLPLTMELLGRMGLANPPLAGMVEAARKAAVAPPFSRSPAEVPAAVRDKSGDPPGLRDQSLKLFEEWVHLLNMHAEDKALLGFLTGAVRSAGVLKMDDTTDRFLRTLTELAVAHCLASAEAAAAAASSGGRPEAVGSGPLSFIATDALVSLVVALVVPLAGGEALLSRYLALLVGLIKRDADEVATKFNARPYLRIWVGLISELGAAPGSHAAAAAAAAAAGNGAAASGAASPDGAAAASSPPAAADPAAQLRYLRACGLALHALQPLSVPGFAFAWLELISHRAFMPRLLTAPGSSGWPLFAGLLIALLRFLEPCLRAADLSDAIKQLYKGCLRLLLVLLHDFPEFLCEHHFSLCEAIPPPAVQMRNLVLSAFPRNMRLPDPFTPNLKVDLLPEIQQLPRIVPEPESLLPEGLRAQVDSFLRSRQPPNLPAELARRCSMSAGGASSPGPADKASSPGGPLGGAGAGGVNAPLINALVLYIGSQAKSVSSPLHPGAQELYVRLAGELDAEGRYLLLNGMANQLRYPNAHTYYFSCTLLTLFLESKSEGLKEQITRTLLERLIVNRPHPWGLLITFIELIKNRRYNFWAHSFTKCAPEIENLFTSVSRSCLGTNRAEEEAAAAVHAKDGAVAVRA